MLTNTYSQYLDNNFKYNDTFRTNGQTPFTGRYVEMYSNGHTRVYGKFKGGLMDSFLYFYNIDGVSTSAVLRSNDTIKTLKYNEDGKMVNETLSINDTPFIVKTYYNDKYNSIKSIFRYENGKLNGRSHSFYKKNKSTDVSAISIETMYHYGVKNGVECFYFISGKPKVLACYSMDTMCYRIFYNKQGEQSSVEVNTGGKKPEKKGIPDAICNCASLTFKD